MTGFEVRLIDGPAFGWGWLTMIEPDSRVAIAPQPARVDEWMHVVLDETAPPWPGQVVYERHDTDLGSNEDGDVVLPYVVVGDDN